MAQCLGGHGIWGAGIGFLQYSFLLFCSSCFVLLDAYIIHCFNKCFQDNIFIQLKPQVFSSHLTRLMQSYIQPTEKEQSASLSMKGSQGRPLW